ncbi:hypothetical protein JX266_014059 [Neoarthrinium moseri]|nr:hypothetical protein JX266_014059 [Neoarthrinium moseri]
MLLVPLSLLGAAFASTFVMRDLAGSLASASTCTSTTVYPTITSSCQGYDTYALSGHQQSSAPEAFQEVTSSAEQAINPSTIYTSQTVSSASEAAPAGSSVHNPVAVAAASSRMYPFVIGIACLAAFLI